MENKIIDKINKLLKLSQSSNIEEAMSAYDKANDISLNSQVSSTKMTRGYINA